jgi:hypothetical protein
MRKIILSLLVALIIGVLFLLVNPLAIVRSKLDQSPVLSQRYLRIGLGKSYSTTVIPANGVIARQSSVNFMLKYKELLEQGKLFKPGQEWPDKK